MITFGYLSFTFVHVVYVSRTVNVLVSPLPVKPGGGGALAFVARSSIKYLKQCFSLCSLYCNNCRINSIIMLFVCI